MRIGIDARFYGSLGKGLGRYTEKLLEHLECIDTENEYTVFLRQENFLEYTPKNPSFKKVIAQYAWYGFAEQSLFVLLLYRYHFDLVHFPHFNVPLLYRKKFVVTIHDLILIRYPTIRSTTRFAWLYWMKFLVYRKVIASAVRRAAHIITVSYFTKEDIIKQFPGLGNKISVTHEAADDFCQFNQPQQEQATLTRFGLLKKPIQSPDASAWRDRIQPYFLYVGNAYPHKNLSILFSVAKEFSHYKIVLVGKEDFFYRGLKARVKKIGIPNVVFTGFVNDAELSSLYRFARAYVFPSLYEGFGLPPLEAMTRGTPVISSRSGSLPEILGTAAQYFNATESAGLIEVLRRVENNTALRQTMKKAGYQQVAKYHFRAMALATHKIYQVSFQNKI